MIVLLLKQLIDQQHSLMRYYTASKVLSCFTWAVSVSMLVLRRARALSDVRQAGTALSESEARFSAVFHQAAVGFVQVDLDSDRLVRMNQKFCDLLGYTEQEPAANALPGHHRGRGSAGRSGANGAPARRRAARLPDGEALPAQGWWRRMGRAVGVAPAPGRWHWLPPGRGAGHPASASAWSRPCAAASSACSAS